MSKSEVRQEGAADPTDAVEAGKKSLDTGTNETVTESVTPPEPPTLGPADVLEGLEQMPAVQPHAVEAAKADAAGAPAQQQQGSPAPSADPDPRHPTRFDPAIHESNPDGTPRLSNGKLRLKRGRGASTFKGAAPSKPAPSILGTPPGSAPAGEAPAQNVPNPFDPARIDVCAKTMTHLFFAAGCVVFGEDGQPIVKAGVDEPKEVYSAFHSYYTIKGAKDIPPGVVLVCALVAYGQRRIAMPTVKSRFARFKEKVTLWYVKLRLRKGAKKPEPAQEVPQPSENEERPAA